MARKTGIRTMGAPPKPIAKRTPPRRVTTRPLTARQRTFLERYLLHLNATKAYQEAYPGAAWISTNSQGSTLLKDPRVAQEVRRRIAEVTKRYRSTANKALGELAALAFSNVKDYYDRDGKLLPLDELPVYAAAAVKKVKSKEVKAFDLATGEEKVVGHERELELHDKIAALRMIGQHEGLFAERIELPVGADFATALREARARAIAVAAAVELAPIEGEKVAK